MDGANMQEIKTQVAVLEQMISELRTHFDAYEQDNKQFHSEFLEHVKASTLLTANVAALTNNVASLTHAVKVLSEEQLKYQTAGKVIGKVAAIFAGVATAAWAVFTFFANQGAK